MRFCAAAVLHAPPIALWPTISRFQATTSVQEEQNEQQAEAEGLNKQSTEKQEESSEPEPVIPKSSKITGPKAAPQKSTPPQKPPLPAATGSTQPQGTLPGIRASLVGYLHNLMALFWGTITWLQSKLGMNSKSSSKQKHAKRQVGAVMHGCILLKFVASHTFLCQKPSAFTSPLH